MSPFTRASAGVRRLHAVRLAVVPQPRVARPTGEEENTAAPDPTEYMDVAEVSGDACGPDSSRPDRFFHPVAARPYNTGAVPLDDVGALVAAVRENGFVVLRSLMPATWVASCRAAFEPRLAEYLRRKGPDQSNRGPNRHYIDLPMRAPFVNMLANQTISK